MTVVRLNMYLHLIREAKSKGKGGRSGCKPFCTADSAYRYAYDFNDIGNRVTSYHNADTNLYTANCLNQYTTITNLCLSAPPHDETNPVNPVNPVNTNPCAYDADGKSLRGSCLI